MHFKETLVVHVLSLLIGFITHLTDVYIAEN